MLINDVKRPFCDRNPVNGQQLTPNKPMIEEKPMCPQPKNRNLILPLILLFLAGGVFAQNVDETIDDVTDRVARISFLEGDVQIRRAGSDEWEKAVADLPIVEGDEIVTEADGRFEIQFDNGTHIRVTRNSILKIAALTDEGIAVSLSRGSLNLTVRKFDADKSFIEIDAPKTTVAVLRAGRYRVDAGEDGDAEVRVGVSSDGEARVYSNNAGFTLKSGRSASLFVDGVNAGEWETRDFAGIGDEFDKWTFDRDADFVQRLANANYDTYYDDSIYGAEDLNSYGNWVHSTSYGYVWQPSASSLRRYSDWSPYRYGHWRWIPSFGWSWVNDEPWGWATYHHGRWLWDNGNWYWSPYNSNRTRRNPWRPALVYLTVINNNICWYPLPYNASYYNYNSRFQNRRRRDRDNRNSTGSTQPITTQTTGGVPISRTRRGLGGRIIPPRDFPSSAVTAISADEFGRGRQGFRRASMTVASTVLSTDNTEQTDPVLPAFRELNGRVSSEIISNRRPVSRQGSPVIIGAAERRSNTPLDRDLRNTRFFGNRRPNGIETGERDARPSPIRPTPIRTGAVGRPETRRESPPITTPQAETPPYIPRRREIPANTEKTEQSPPVQRRKTPIVQPRNTETPRVAPSRRTESAPQRRYEPPARRQETPRSEPSASNTETPRAAPSRRPESAPQQQRYEPPARRQETPRSEPPQRSEPAPRRERPASPPRESGNSSTQKSAPARPAPPSERKTRPD